MTCFEKTLIPFSMLVASELILDKTAVLEMCTLQHVIQKYTRRFFFYETSIFYSPGTHWEDNMKVIGGIINSSFDKKSLLIAQALIFSKNWLVSFPTVVLRDDFTIAWAASFELFVFDQLFSFLALGQVLIQVNAIVRFVFMTPYVVMAGVTR